MMEFVNKYGGGNASIWFAEVPHMGRTTPDIHTRASEDGNMSLSRKSSIMKSVWSTFRSDP